MEFDSPSWTTVVQLFDTATALPEQERDRWLRAECDGNSALYHEVRSLLDAATAERDASRTAIVITSVEGRRYGPWQAVRLLGSGGMGSVLLVRRADGQFEQTAALKLLGPHLAGEYFLDRFRGERQILAQLNHPNITKLLDGGITADGVPYLVMEYVEGERADAYCDHHHLDIPARLKIFSAVCEAVQSAHRALVAHLDLKPSNILVTADGAPKLLDFGTAKLIAYDSDQTTTRALTPDYASPEQLRAEPVTTACDIYSLGVILYELLVGRRPFDRSSWASVLERAVGNTQPDALSSAITPEVAACRSTTVSALEQRLRGDLSSIVLKAMDPSPARRYQSPSELAADIDRYLEGRPVTAERQTRRYRMRKFVQRHSRAVMASVVLLCVLTALAWTAVRGEQRALLEARRAQDMNRFLTNLFFLADPSIGGRVGMTVKDLLESAESGGALNVNQDPTTQADIYELLAHSFTGQGALAKALAFDERAVAAATEAGDDGRRGAYVAELAYAHAAMAHPQPAIRFADEALNLLRREPRAFSPLHRFMVLNYCGVVLAGLPGRDIVPLREEALRVARANPKELGNVFVSFALMSLGSAYLGRGRLDEAEALTREAIGIERSAGNRPALLAEDLQALAWIAYARGNYAECARLHRESHALMLRSFGPDHPLALIQQAELALALAYSGSMKEAAEQASDAIARYRAAGAPALALQAVSQGGVVLALNHMYPQAEAAANEVLHRLGSAQPQDTRWQEARAALALALAGEGRRAGARPLLEASVRYYQASKTPLGITLREALAKTAP